MLNQRHIGLLGLLVVFSGFGFAQAFSAIRINATPSFPRGLWRIDSSAQPESWKNRLVLVCPPNSSVVKEAFTRGYLAKGHCEVGTIPLIKRVVAVAGDRVSVSEQGVSINGSPIPKSRPYHLDGKGRLMPLSKGKTLENDEVWLMSDWNEKSFDSRYFGAVKARSIEGAIKPLLIWGDDVTL